MPPPPCRTAPCFPGPKVTATTEKLFCKKKKKSLPFCIILLGRVGFKEPHCLSGGHWNLPEVGWESNSGWKAKRRGKKRQVTKTPIIHLPFCEMLLHERKCPSNEPLGSPRGCLWPWGATPGKAGAVHRVLALAIVISIVLVLAKARIEAPLLLAHSKLHSLKWLLQQAARQLCLTKPRAPLRSERAPGRAPPSSQRPPNRPAW